MQIVIPMSGFGERFRRAGYARPKPLIELEGKPIIAHVIAMFPGETDFLFICNQDHLDDPTYGLEATLRQWCPTGRVIGIAPHKRGPVHAVQQVEHLLKPEQPVVVNYCDFTCYWNWAHFQAFVQETACAGAIPAYRGFHPHSLGTTNYAYVRESDGWVEDIQEKQPFTSDRMAEYASSGTYYFASAALMRQAFQETVAQGLAVSGEYYVSLAYKPLLASGQPVAVYPLQHFMQWGTPEDVAEYRTWSEAFRALVASPRGQGVPRGSVVVPMAGLGQRFADEGYPLPKPLIPVSGRPMVLQATASLPPARRYAFVLRADMPGCEAVSAELLRQYPGAHLETLAGVTEGQACSALLGLEALEAAQGPLEGPITFGACDHGMVYDAGQFEALCADPEVDVIVWAIRGYPYAARHPQMFGWIEAEAGRVRSVSVKVPLADPATDPLVLGTFTFRRAQDVKRCVERLMQRDGRVNGEFYLDACLNDALALGLNCRLFEVEAYLGWGTPNDLRTFEYWQSCFHKWEGHPY
ncbi:MAG: sugar phosphate nucleotidyltransferase, partial [Candidatus Sericytochromatia bacterium]|nr:sugar phosphate nucleotidyltransferase [Candidatus Sericytochromatia bacterium]